MLTMDEIAVEIEQFFVEREPNWTEQEIALARMEFLLSIHYKPEETIYPAHGEQSEDVLRAQLISYALSDLGWTGFGEGE